MEPCKWRGFCNRLAEMRCNIKVAYKSFEKVAKLKLQVVVRDQNCIQEEIKCGLNLGNVLYKSFQNISFSPFLFNIVNIKVSRKMYL